MLKQSSSGMSSVQSMRSGDGGDYAFNDSSSRPWKVRQVCFGVLTSLLKGYRDHIKVPEAVASPPANMASSSSSSSSNNNNNNSNSSRPYFDVGGFLAARLEPYPDQEMHLVPFMRIFLSQTMFSRYMHARAAALSADALDLAVTESRTRRAIRVSRSSAMAVQKLGVAWKAKKNTHGGQFWGPQRWNERFFELHQVPPPLPPQPSPSQSLSPSQPPHTPIGHPTAPPPHIVARTVRRIDPHHE